MGRRKKEPEGFHRQQIAQTAERLFTQQGIAGTTMDDVAKAAGYSKATLYVYYQNKEELVGALVGSSMKLLHGHICRAMTAAGNTRQRYDALCQELVRYQAEYPFYFEIVLGEINIDFEREDSLAVDRETFAVGELINVEIAKLLQMGIARGELRQDLDILQTVFVFWASLSGVILMCSKKAAYVEKILGKTREQFLSGGFDTLYHAIAKPAVRQEERRI